MAKFKKGDLVLINSGGPTMTIDRLQSPSTFSDGDAQGYRCSWFAGAKIQHAFFDEEVLEAVDDEGE